MTLKPALICLLSIMLYAPAVPALKSGAPLPANLFIELAKKINPAVVSISISINLRSRPQNYYRDPFWDYFNQFLIPRDQLRPKRKPRPVGTGFIIDKSGLVVTNYHVVNHADSIRVQIANDKTLYEADYLGGDERTDVAILQIKSDKNFAYAKLGDSDKVEVGEWVAAFGNPYGHEFSMSKGIISAKGRLIRDLNSIPFLQTDASINPGNSGGPLVNTDGQVVAMNTAIDARAQGIGFAIPVNHIKKILPELKKYGKVMRGYIGVQIGNISFQAQRALGLINNHGALVMGVEPGSPAHAAGLEPYDVITRFEQRAVNSADDLIDAIKDFPIGKKANLNIIRNSEKKKVSIEVSAPENAAPIRRKVGRGSKTKSSKTLGFKVENYSTITAKKLGLSPQKDQPPIVTEVKKDSPANRSGLRVGDLVLDVNQKPVKSAKEVFKYLQKGPNILRIRNGTQVSLVFLEI